VARINAEAGKAPVPVAPEVFEVIRGATNVSRVTGGAFDITVASVSALWRIDGENPRVPSKQEIRKALANVGWRHVRLDERSRTVFLDAPDVRIGLGGIAKGYAVDRAIAVLGSRGVRSAILTAGGDTGLLGRDGDRPWRIGIRHPRSPGRTIAWLDAAETTVHTSGDYERFLIVKGKRYGHILDPRSGWPASEVRAVSVVTKDGTFGDALATGIFVLGPKQGLRLAGSLPGVEALIVDSRGQVTMTPGLRGRARVTP
jgi:thiamine biosynthesis lipoprotein